MAKYKSLVEIQGSIDDLVFYNLNGIPVVRRKSGFNKDSFKNNPNYAKVRENSSEFGHCSKSGKMIRESLNAYIADNGDKYLYQKFAKVMTQIKDLDTISERGKRRIPNGLKHPAAAVLLRDFNFGIFENLSAVAQLSEVLFGKEITISKPSDYDEAVFMAIEIDFEKYHIKSHEQPFKILPKQISYNVENVESVAPLLYFLVLKKSGKILRTGFL